MISIIRAGLLIWVQRFVSLRALARSVVTLLGGLPISAYHMCLAIDAALNARVSPEHWKTFASANLCATSDETVRSLAYQLLCGLLVGFQAFGEYWATHWGETAILLLTLYLLHTEFHQMRRRWKHIRWLGKPPD